MQSRKVAGNGAAGQASTGIDLQVEVDLGTVVELADGFGIALTALELSVDLVVDGGGEGGKAIGAVRADDVGFHGASASVGDVNDGVGKRIVLRVEHFAEEQAADRLLFLVRRGAGERTKDGQQAQQESRTALITERL